MTSLTAIADSAAAPGPSAARDGLAALDDPTLQHASTRWTQDADGHRVASTSLVLGGIDCAACAAPIEAALRAVPGVLQVEVSAAAQRAEVRWDPARTRLSALVLAVRDAGYDALPDAAAPARQLRQRERRTAMWRLFVAGFCAMQIMMFATPGYVAAAGELAPDLRQLLNWGSWLLSLPVLLFSAGPFFRGTWRALRQHRLGMDVPVTLGIVVCFVASSGATFEPGGLFGQEVYFDSLSMFVSFLLGARYLETIARHRAAESLEAAVAALPETAALVGPDGQLADVPIERLQPGDVVHIALGDKVPADGVLISGRTQLDESLLTGESLPVPRGEGDALVGGSANLGAPVRMRVERVGPDTRHGAIVALMREALVQRPALARQADAWAAPFLWVVLVLAAAAGLAWAWIEPARAVSVAVAVLIVTCPCALSLAVPSTLVAVAGALARRGVMLQRLDAIEALARLDQLFIDKTGTLTEDQPVWASTVAIAPDGARSTPEPLLVAAAQALAAWSTHPLSRALAAAAPKAPSPTWVGVEEAPGQGMQARDAAGQPWRLGRWAWVRDAADQPAPPDADDAVVWFGQVGRPCLRFGFDEQLRPDAVEAVTALQRDGLRVTLLSGDNPARAARLATRLRLSASIGGASPQDKLATLAAAQARGERCGMVGDGVNDAPVLARADVSFAMGRGAAVSRLHADGVLCSNRLSDLAAARALALRAMRVTRQNLAWAALYNLACVPLALAGLLPPWAAGLGMAASSLLVVGNALRLTRA